MALTIGINSTNFNICSGVNLAYATTSTAGVYKFRFLMEVTYTLQNSNGATPETRTVKFTQQQNNDDSAVFSLSEIYKSIVTPQITGGDKENYIGSTDPNQYSSIHNLPYTTGTDQHMFSWGILDNINGYEAFKGVANVLKIEFFEMYSSTPSGIPIKQTTGGTHEYDIYMFYGRGQEEEGVVVDFNPYLLTDGTKQFLSSNYEYRIDGVKAERYTTRLSKDEYHTIAFLNRCAINTSSAPFRLRVFFYDSTGSQIGDLRMNNTTSSGGSYSSATDNESFYLYCGMGLKNLAKIDISHASYGGDVPVDGFIGTNKIAYYFVVAQNTGGANNKSERYDFEVITYCSDYEQTRLSYMNRFGAWEYITLNMERKDSLNVKREYITKPVINQSVTLATTSVDALNGSYPLDVAKQGKMTTSVKIDESFTVFTDYLKDYQIAQIKDLMMSPQIHLLDGENAKALILETSTMKLKGEKTRGLFQYELKFKFANPKYSTI